MITHTTCPVCQHGDSRVLGEYSGHVTNPPTTIHEAGANAILKHVLHTDSYKVMTYQCRRCRHVYLSPSFSEEEIPRLYSEAVHVETKNQYRVWEKNSGETWAKAHGVDRVDQKSMLDRVTELRARALAEFYESATGRSPLQVASVCDVGGMTGELAGRFENAKQYVFDTNLSHVVESVIPIQDRAQLQASAPYDLLIFSHVMEHVTLPTAFLETFADLLSDSGLIYVEVPLEYCGTVVKRKGAPLTGHVNYFTPSSVRALLSASGFGEILKLARVPIWYGEQRMVAIKAMARKSRDRSVRAGGFRSDWELLCDSLLTWRCRKNAARCIQELNSAQETPAG